MNVSESITAAIEKFVSVGLSEDQAHGCALGLIEGLVEQIATPQQKAEIAAVIRIICESSMLPVETLVH